MQFVDVIAFKKGNTPPLCTNVYGSVWHGRIVWCYDSDDGGLVCLHKVSMAWSSGCMDGAGMGVSCTITVGKCSIG